MPAVPPKRENLFLNLLCNIAVPTIVLMKFSSDKWLGPQWGMLVALAFPLGYLVYDLIKRRKTNVFSVVGIASVLLTGTLNQLKADGFWFAVKEGAVPLVFGAAVLISMRTKQPLVHEMLWNDQVIDTAKVNAALAERGNQSAFARLLDRASYGMALSFLLSSVLNFGLARYLLRSPPGTEAFNAELGKMQMLSWPVIVLPTMAVTIVVFYRLITGMTQLTGLDFEAIIHGGKPKPDPAAGAGR